MEHKHRQAQLQQVHATLQSAQAKVQQLQQQQAAGGGGEGEKGQREGERECVRPLMPVVVQCV